MLFLKLNLTFFTEIRFYIPKYFQLYSRYMWGLSIVLSTLNLTSFQIVTKFDWFKRYYAGNWIVKRDKYLKSRSLAGSRTLIPIFSQFSNSVKRNFFNRITLWMLYVCSWDQFVQSKPKAFEKSYSRVGLIYLNYSQSFRI